MKERIAVNKGRLLLKIEERSGAVFTHYIWLGTLVDNRIMFLFGIFGILVRHFKFWFQYFSFCQF